MRATTDAIPSESMCGHHADLAVHRGSVERHTWEGRAEHTCVCAPLVMCAVCYVAEIRDHAFILGEAAWFRMERKVRVGEKAAPASLSTSPRLASYRPAKAAVVGL